MKNLKCVKCGNKFDKQSKIPHILPHCGHTVCEFCISFELKNFKRFDCPKD